METNFNNLPESVRQLHMKLDFIEQLILNTSQPETDIWFDIDEVCQYLPQKPAKQTLYSWVRKRIVPFHKNGKKLAFLKSEIDLWLKQGRQKTYSEIEAEAESYLK